MLRGKVVIIDQICSTDDVISLSSHMVNQQWLCNPPSLHWRTYHSWWHLHSPYLLFFLSSFIICHLLFYSQPLLLLTMFPLILLRSNWMMVQPLSLRNVLVCKVKYNVTIWQLFWCSHITISLSLTKRVAEKNRKKLWKRRSSPAT